MYLHKNPRPIHNRWLVRCLGKKTLSSLPYEVVYFWNHPSIGPMTLCNIDGFSFLGNSIPCYTHPKTLLTRTFSTDCCVFGRLSSVTFPHGQLPIWLWHVTMPFHIFRPLLRGNEKNSFLLRLNNSKQRSESSTRCFCSPVTTLGAPFRQKFSHTQMFVLNVVRNTAFRRLYDVNYVPKLCFTVVSPLWSRFFF